jgi:hypothetical protein
MPSCNQKYCHSVRIQEFSKVFFQLVQTKVGAEQKIIICPTFSRNSLYLDTAKVLTVVGCLTILVAFFGFFALHKVCASAKPTFTSFVVAADLFDLCGLNPPYWRVPSRPFPVFQAV